MKAKKSASFTEWSDLTWRERCRAVFWVSLMLVVIFHNAYINAGEEWSVK